MTTLWKRLSGGICRDASPDRIPRDGNLHCRIWLSCERKKHRKHRLLDGNFYRIFHYMAGNKMTLLIAIASLLFGLILGGTIGLFVGMVLAARGDDYA